MLANIIRNTKKTAIGGGGGGIVTGGDPYYSAVSLLLSMDGTNGSTTFTDSGPNALTVTAVGNAQISTTQSKFGGASGYFDGSGDYLILPSSNAFNFGTGDFTLEFWTYPLSGPVNIYNPCFYSQNAWDYAAWAANNAGLRVHHSNVILGGSSFTQINFSSNIQNNQWSHIAVVRAGNTVTVYINGSSVGSATYIGNVGFSTCRPGIGLSDTGSTGGREYPNAYIDDLRITKYARYQSSFTPPTQAHPNIYNPYTTLPVSGAALWLDASQQNTIFTDAGTTPVTTSGQSIYQWNDLSGNNRHAIQATSGNRPTWLPPASGQNGLGAISFNGSNQLISTATSGLSAQPFEYYIVFKFKSTTTNDRIVFGTGDRGNFDGNSGGGWNLFSGALLAGGTRTGTSWAMVNCKFNGSSSALRINASQVLSGNTGTGYPTAFSLAGNGSSDWGDITVAEFVVYPSTLSTGDQNLVESYLKTKWGTP